LAPLLRLAFEIFADERIERKRARPKNEDDHDRKEKEKFVCRDEFVRITEDGANAIDVGGEIRDSKQNHERNGNQPRSQTDEQKQSAEAFQAAGQDGLGVREGNS